MSEPRASRWLASELSRCLDRVSAPDLLWERLQEQPLPRKQRNTLRWPAAAMLALLATATAFPFLGHTARPKLARVSRETQIIRRVQWTCAPPAENPLEDLAVSITPAAHRQSFAVSAQHPNTEAGCHLCHSII
jgi:hypothetical protein